MKMEFYCGRTNDVSPATMLGVRGYEPRAIVVWKNKLDNMSPQQRCEKISPRFQAALMRREFDLLVHGIDRQSGRGLICALKHGESQCDSKRALFAVKDRQSAEKIVDELYITIRKTGNPTSQSSSSKAIDLQELIAAITELREK